PIRVFLSRDRTQPSIEFSIPLEMPQPNDEYALQLLRASGLVTGAQIDSARAVRDGHESIVDIFVRQGVFSADEISRALAAQAHIDWIDLSEIAVAQEIIEELRPQDARRFKIIPISRNEHGLVVATGDPLDVESIDSLSFLLKRPVEVVCTT